MGVKLTTVKKKLGEIIIPGSTIKVYIKYNLPNDKGGIDGYKIYMSDLIDIPFGAGRDEFREIVLNAFAKKHVDLSEFEWLISDDPLIIDTHSRYTMLRITGRIKIKKSNIGRINDEERERVSANAN